MAASDRQNGIVADIAFGSAGITTTTGPLATEVNALTRIECGIVDGPDAERNGSTIDISGLCDQDDRYKAGNIRNEPIEITLWREFDGTDVYWALFDDSSVGTTQHLVIARGGFAGATAAAADVMDVYTVTVMSRSPSAPVRGEAQRFTVMLAVQQVDFDSVAT